MDLVNKYYLFTRNLEVYNHDTIAVKYIHLSITNLTVYQKCTHYTEIKILNFLPTDIKICGNKMPTRCNRGFYCRYYCLLNMSRASPCPSSGAQKYYTVVAACGILCCGFFK